MTAGELFERIITRFEAVPPTVDFLTALQATIKVFADRLWLNKSELLKADFSQSVDADTASFEFPDTFLGLSGLPYHAERKRELPPIPPGRKMYLAETGVPQFHELRGFTMTLYPTPSEAVTIKGEIYQKPEPITDLATDLPFHGVYNDAMEEAVLQVSRVGKAVLTDPAFNSFLDQTISDVSVMRPNKPINWLHQPTGGYRWQY